MNKYEYWNSLLEQNPKMIGATYIKISMKSLREIVFQAHVKGQSYRDRTGVDSILKTMFGNKP